MPVDSCVIITSTVIFHHLPPPLHPLSHALHTASVCRTGVEDQPFHSILPFLFQKLHTHCCLSFIFPPSWATICIFPFHIALQERATLCLFDSTSIASLSIPSPQSPLTTPPHFHFAFVQRELSKPSRHFVLLRARERCAVAYLQLSDDRYTTQLSPTKHLTPKPRNKPHPLFLPRKAFNVSELSECCLTITLSSWMAAHKKSKKSTKTDKKNC